MLDISTQIRSGKCAKWPYDRAGRAKRSLRRSAEGEIATKLPSERSFAEDYGVAYTTVRHAMAVLRERGVIITVHGRGTFVKPENDPH